MSFLPTRSAALLPRLLRRAPRAPALGGVAAPCLVGGAAFRFSSQEAGTEARWEDRLKAVNSTMQADNVKGFYDEWAGDYDECLQAWGYEAPRRAVELLWKHYDEARRGTAARVLDLGCGTGLVGDHAAESERLHGATNPALVGADFSQASLDFIQAKRAGKYAGVTQLDLNAIPYSFKTDEFDALFCCGVLTYAEDMDRVWREMVRVTRSGALMVVTHRSEKMAGDMSVVQALEKEGLLAQVERVEKQPYLPRNPNYEDRIVIDYLVVRNCK